jgi:hypothetical protein
MVSHLYAAVSNSGKYVPRGPSTAEMESVLFPDLRSPSKMDHIAAACALKGALTGVSGPKCLNKMIDHREDDVITAFRHMRQTWPRAHGPLDTVARYTLPVSPPLQTHPSGKVDWTPENISNRVSYGRLEAMDKNDKDAMLCNMAQR